MTHPQDPPSPYDLPDPEPIAPCGCPESECSPAIHNDQRYCQSCDNDLPEIPKETP